jgi:hypothetical protein
MKEFTNVTIYLKNESFGSISHVHCRMVRVETGQKYAQYTNAIKVSFTPKGARRERQVMLTYKPFLIVVSAAKAIEPDGMFGAESTSKTAFGSVSTSRSRYSSFDPRWESDFRAKLEAAKVPILYDVAAPKAIPTEGGFIAKHNEDPFPQVAEDFGPVLNEDGTPTEFTRRFAQAMGTEHKLDEYVASLKKAPNQ